MAIEKANVVHAAGRINGADGAALAPAANVFREWVPARTGAGVYTITLDRAIDATERVVVVSTETLGRTIQVTHTSDTVITINTWSDVAQTMAADCTFDFAVLNVGW